MNLTLQDTQRYARHIVLKGVGAIGQQKLKGARVLVIGAGGLGSPVIAYLAAAGVGRIGIVDDDVVGLSNLQRQIIHPEAGIGAPKVETARAFANGLNPTVEIVPHAVRLSQVNAADLLAGYDILVDGTDNFGTRAVAANAAENASVPLVSGAVSMFDGQVTVLAPHLEDDTGQKLPRFGDLYPHTPDEAALPSCEVVGVLGALTGVIGTLMAMETIKLITGVGTPLFGRLLVYDGRNAKFTEMRYARRA